MANFRGFKSNCFGNRNAVWVNEILLFHLFIWDSRYRGGQYSRKQWRPERTVRRAGTENIANVPLVPVENILLPPLHIKLGIVKNFVKALNREGPAFQILKTIFPRLSEAKLKEGNYIF